jgi:tetratricopeptide (TPR) repeat protein
VLQAGYARLESGPVNSKWALPLLSELEAISQELGNSDQAFQWRQKRDLAIQKGLSRNSRLLQENLNDPGLLISTGSLLSQIGQHEEAAAAYRLAIRLQPDNARTNFLLGNEYAFAGQWNQAIPAFRRAVDLAVNDEPEARYRLAALCLYTGKLDEYRAICRDLLERFGTSNNRNFIDRTAKICLLAPDADDNRARALALAEMNVVAGEKHLDYRWFVLAKGLADYRAGRYDDALKSVKQLNPVSGGGHSDALCFALLAMTEDRLQHSDKARDALASAQEILSNNMPNPAEGRPFGDNWNDWLHCQILFREAKGMIEKSDEEKPEQNRPQNESGKLIR